LGVHAENTIRVRDRNTVWPLIAYVAEVAVWAALLFVLGRIGQQFATISTRVSAVVPGAGVALAMILWRGNKMALALLISAFCSNYFNKLEIFQALISEGSVNGPDFLRALIFACLGTSITLIGAGLVRHFAGPVIDFRSVRQVMKFLFWGAVVRSALLTTARLPLLVHYGELSGDRFVSAWITGFVGGATSVVVFTTFILAWVQPAPPGAGEASKAETFIILLLLGSLTLADYFTDLPLSFLPFPVLVWAGLRLDTRALASGVVIVVVVSLVAAASGLSTFGLPQENPNTALVLFQVFVICVAVTGLALGTVASERRRTLRETAELSSFQRAVLDGSNVAIIVGNEDLTIRSVNKCAELMLGYSAAEMTGRTPELWHDKEELAAAAKQLSEKTGKPVSGLELFTLVPNAGKPFEHEWTFIRKDGSRLQVFLSVTRLESPFTGYMGVAVDITSRKEAESQMRAARVAAEQANRTKSEFLANVSHEIRTPMNAVLGFAELLERSLNDPGQKKQARAITTSGRTLLQLLNDILDLSKVEAGRLDIQPGPVDVRRFVEDVAQFYGVKAEEKGITMTVDIQGDLNGKYLLDEVRLRQILFNLVGNALKFTEKGSVTLGAGANANEDGSHRLFFEVRDTGVGIPASQVENIFTPFHQQSGQSARKYGGTGLGLNISRRLVELMGGSLLASSEIGRGSCFRLTLPCVIQVMKAPQAPQVAPDLKPADLQRAPEMEVEPLTLEAQLVWKHCAEQAAGPWQMVWENLRQTPLADEVEHFGRQLAQAGGTGTPGFLRDYGERLAQQAHAFEVEAMAKTLGEFPDITARLERETSEAIAPGA